MSKGLNLGVGTLGLAYVYLVDSLAMPLAAL